MANETLARRYAGAIFGLATSANVADRVGEELASTTATFAADPMLAEFFTAPIIDRGEKERILAHAFAGKLHEVALHSLLLLVRKRRETLLPEIVAQYRTLQMRARGADLLTLTSAQPLADAQAKTLVAAATRVFGKTFEVAQRVDPKLIGGVRMSVGDRAIDGTIAGRLDDLARTLFAPT